MLGGRWSATRGGAVTAGVVVPRLGGDQLRWQGEGPVGGRGCVGGGVGRRWGPQLAMVALDGEWPIGRGVTWPLNGRMFTRPVCVTRTIKWSCDQLIKP